MTKSNQSGFAVAEALLGLVIIGILGFTGSFVWHAKQNTDKSLNAANKSQPVIASKKQAATRTQTSSSTDGTSNWVLYTVPGKEYSIRLADGWKLNHCTGTPFLYTYVHTDVLLHAGQKAVVTDINCGSDGGGDGLGIGFTTQLNEVTTTSPQTSSFQTAEGLTVKVYSKVEDSSANGIGAVNTGGNSYYYVISKSATSTVYVSYGVNQGQTDDHLTVEKSIKTLRIK